VAIIRENTSKFFPLIYYDHFGHSEVSSPSFKKGYEHIVGRLPSYYKGNILQLGSPTYDIKHGHDIAIMIFWEHEIASDH
jgi:hypothetical protein